jgi:hypothetical protein
MDTDIEVRPPRHSRRVEAWVYTILNPLISNLRREADLLKKGNLTWRWYSRRCEYIRPVREYMENSHWPNYEDFLADALNQGFKEHFDKHDQALAEVESSASRFFDGLMQAGIFRDQVERSLKDYESTGVRLENPSLDSMKGELPKYVAEYLINRTEILPHHYMAHKFWQDYRSEFERSAEEFESYQQRQSFRALKTASGLLKEVSENLLNRLKEHRLFLCRTYDVPAAPIYPSESMRADAFID